MIRLTVPPKNPVIEYPMTGAGAWYDHSLFQIIAHPAITGRHVKTSIMSLVLGNLDPRKPVARMTMKQRPPRGNWNRMDSRVFQPKVLTIRGPKPLTAPFTVYLPRY